MGPLTDLTLAKRIEDFFKSKKLDRFELVDENYTSLLKQTPNDFINSCGNESIDLLFFYRGTSLFRPYILDERVIIQNKMNKLPLNFRNYNEKLGSLLDDDSLP